MDAGKRIFAQAGIAQSRFSYSRPDASFFTTLFEATWENLERSGIGDGYAEIPFVYFKDIEGNPRNQTVSSIVIGVKAIDGNGFNINFANDNLASLLFPTSRQPSPHIIYSDALAFHVEYSLWRSFYVLLFDALLEDVNLHDENLQATLYLKDLSSQLQVVSRLEDMDRINIGVLLEDSSGTVRDLDWMVEEGWEVQTTHDTHRIPLTNAFHESAHEIVRQALRRDFTYPRLLGSISGLTMRPLVSKFMPTMAQHIYDAARGPTTNQEYIYFIAEGLAGRIAEDMLSGTFRFIELNTSVGMISGDDINVWNTVHEGVCLHLSYNEEECTLSRNPTEWSQWKEQLSSVEQEAFDREQKAWILVANILAREVLITHTNTWVQLTRLLLQKGRLRAWDLQEFYGSTENTLTTNSLRPLIDNIDRRSLTDQGAMALETLESLGFVNRYAPALGPMFTLSLEDIFNALGLTDLWDDLERDILYRSLSMAFALDMDQNFDRVRAMSLEEVFDEVKRVDIPNVFLPYIQNNNRARNVERAYSEGLPAIYFEYLIRAL